MKFATLMSVLIGLNASAALPTRVILKCRNAGQDRTLKIEETSQAYAITMTDFEEKQHVGTSYVYKSPNVEVTPNRFSVDTYTIEIGDAAVLYGEVAAKQKVFRTLVPDAPKFNRELLKCTH